MGTRIAVCLNCQQDAVIAAHGLCYACYRAEERADVAASRGDRHNGAIRREQQKLFRAYSQVMIGLSKLGVSDPDMNDMLRMLQPYLAPIAHLLRKSVNEQQKNVHRSLAEGDRP